MYGCSVRFTSLFFCTKAIYVLGTTIIAIVLYAAAAAIAASSCLLKLKIELNFMKRVISKVPTIWYLFTNGIKRSLHLSNREGRKKNLSERHQKPIDPMYLYMNGFGLINVVAL